MKEEYKECPHCHNIVDKDSNQCPYCLSSFYTNDNLNIINGFFNEYKKSYSGENNENYNGISTNNEDLNFKEEIEENKSIQDTYLKILFKKKIKIDEQRLQKLYGNRKHGKLITILYIIIILIMTFLMPLRILIFNQNFRE